MLHDLLSRLQSERASDLLLVSGVPPAACVHGHWQAFDDTPLNPAQIETMILGALSEPQRQQLAEIRDLDFGLSVPGLGRYRVNAHYQRGSLAAAIRAIPAEPPAFADLNLPPQILEFADYPHGLVLVTGGTGQGKSTTLASMLDHLNHTRSAHIVTIEDPIEFEFINDRCIIEQREIGADSPSFASALRHVLRQRPDVILLGEMRDLETIAAAMTAAETGQLVLASLHTAGAVATLSRIIDVFPPGQQAQIRTQLAGSLRAVVCQALLRSAVGQGLVPATEVLVATPAIRRAIRDNEAHLIYGMLETGRKAGMTTMEQALAEQVRQGQVRPEDALSAASDAARLEKLIGGAAQPEWDMHRLECGTRG
jgi:twitching motility protein PilT